MNILQRTELVKTFAEHLAGHQLDREQVHLLQLALARSEDKQPDEDQCARLELWFIARRISGKPLHKLLVCACTIDRLAGSFERADTPNED